MSRTITFVSESRKGGRDLSTPKLTWAIAEQRTDPLGLQPLSCRFASLRNFRVAPFRRPYWLLYWSPCVNTVFRFGNTEVRTRPDRVLVLPYETAYAARMDEPLEDKPGEAHHCVDHDAEAADAPALIASGHLLLFTLAFRLDGFWNSAPAGIHVLSPQDLGLSAGEELVRLARPIGHVFNAS